MHKGVVLNSNGYLCFWLDESATDRMLAPCSSVKSASAATPTSIWSRRSARMAGPSSASSAISGARKTLNVAVTLTAWRDLGEELPAADQDGRTLVARCIKDLVEERLFARRRSLLPIFRSCSWLTSPSSGIVSTYRRPLPSTNLGFINAIMWDGREPSLESQAADATTGHAQATTPPTTRRCRGS